MGAIVGLSGAEYCTWPWWGIIVAVAVAAIALSIHRLRLLGVVLAVGTAFLWRWQVITQVRPTSIAAVQETVVVTGTVLESPVHWYDQQRLILGDLVVGGPRTGKIVVDVPIFPAYTLGQRLDVQCTLVPIPDRQRWRLWSQGIMAACEDAQVQKTRVVRPTWRLRLAMLTNGTIKRIAQQYVEPQASLLSGILLGSQAGMPADLRQQFQATGTTHIVALSGFNVTIILSTISGWLGLLIGRRWAWLPALCFVLVFIVMTGASASIVRAGVMAAIGSVALWTGRPVAPLRLLIFTALVMLWNDPLILWHDLGFQLSFAATAGLVFWSESIAERLTWLPERLNLRSSLATTLAAMLVTEPILLWNFGRMSLIAPLVNIMVLPLIPIAMGVGFAWSVLSLIPIAGYALQPFSDVLLRAIIAVIRGGANLPLAQVELTPLQTLPLTVALIVTAVYLKTHHVPPTPLPR